MYDNFKYGRSLGSATAEEERYHKQLRGKERRSNLRAAIAVAMHRNNIDAATIDKIMNEAYILNISCKINNESVYSLMQAETGLLKI